MVSFNHHDSGEPSFLQLSSLKNSIVANLPRREFQLSDEFLRKQAITWDRLLESASRLLAFTPPPTRNSQSVVTPHADLPRVVISILNRCQLMIWMYETRAETPSPPDKWVAFLIRTEEAVQQDLIELRRIVGDSRVETQFRFRTTDLVNQLFEFFDRLCNSLR